MEILNLVQGSNEWLEARKKYMTASDASSMMGASKYKSRNQLIEEKKFGISENITPAKQALFAKGHEAEDLARSVLEVEMLEDFAPSVGVLDVDGVPLLASFDGLSEDGQTVFEHKLYNETLAENVKRGAIEASHFWQLEHQLLVSGASSVIFVVSDGTAERRAMMTYESIPERRKDLVEGWKQFISDMGAYEMKAKVEKVEAQVDSLPSIVCTVSNGQISTNIESCLEKIKGLAEVEIGKALETDLDFANKEQQNKDVKSLRAKLKEKIEQVRGEFVTYAQFESVANELDSVLQKMQSDGEKKVKAEKENKKKAIVEAAKADLNSHIASLNADLSPFTIESIVGTPNPDWAGAVKNKRTIESIESSVSEEAARHKIEANKVADIAKPNIAFLLSEAKNHEFLFGDAPSLVNQSEESFKAVVTSRISAHEEEQKQKLEAQRQAIRKEEAEKLKAQAEAEEKKVAKEGSFKEIKCYCLAQLASEDVEHGLRTLSNDIAQFSGNAIFDECYASVTAHYEELKANEAAVKKERMAKQAESKSNYVDGVAVGVKAPEPKPEPEAKPLTLQEEVIQVAESYAYKWGVTLDEAEMMKADLAKLFN